MDKIHDALNDIEDYVSFGWRRGDVKRQEETDFVTFGTPSILQESVHRVDKDAQKSKEYHRDSLSMIVDEVKQCTLCGLHKRRQNAVPGVGVSTPIVLVVGEGPGFEEDRQGMPFVGPAGKYLDSWLEAIGLSRKKNIYIANVVKCRPPSNRDPFDEEIVACSSFLTRQIAFLQPKVIFVLGRIAFRALTQSRMGISSAHGQWYTYQDIPLLPTFHPSAVLRNQNLKRDVWNDLKKLEVHLIEHCKEYATERSK